MPFHEPCLACMSWYRAIANDMLDKEIRLYNIQELKAWFKKLLRVNKNHGVNVVACSDPVLLPFIKAGRGVLPNVADLCLRLKAVHVSIDDDFPDLPSPVSVRSFTPSVSSQDLPVTFSQVVKGVTDTPPRVEVAGSASAPQLTTVASRKTAALGSEPTLGESSSPGVDATENPLVKEIISFMNVRFKSYEDTLGSMIEKVAAGEKDIASLRQQAFLSRV